MTLCTKFERNRVIRGGVIDDLARLRRVIWGGGGTTDRAYSGARGHNFTKRRKSIGDHRSIAHLF